MILIDNYDSFTYNIVHYFKEMGVNPRVFTRNEINVKAFADIDFDRIVLSPGPGHPIEADLCLDLIHRYHPTKKILGICLGHQCIAHAFGASIGKINVLPMARPRLYIIQELLFLKGYLKDFRPVVIIP